MNFNEFGGKWSWPNRGTILEFASRDRVKPRRTSVRIADVLTEIRTKDLQNTSVERYRHANSLDAFGKQPTCVTCGHKLPVWVHETADSAARNTPPSLQLSVCRECRGPYHAAHSFIARVWHSSVLIPGLRGSSSWAETSNRGAVDYTEGCKPIPGGAPRAGVLGAGVSWADPTKQSPSSEADSRSATQQIPHIL
jgi:hypothetical protein